MLKRDQTGIDKAITELSRDQAISLLQATIHLLCDIPDKVSSIARITEEDDLVVEGITADVGNVLIDLLTKINTKP